MSAGKISDPGLIPYEAVRWLITQWRVVGGVAGLAAVGGAAGSYFLPEEYVATTSFAVEASQTPRLPTGLSGLAGQLGINVGAATSESPQFYANLATSRDVLSELLNEATGGTSGDAKMRGTLLQYLVHQGKDSALRLERGITRLRKRLGATVDRQTGVVRIDVRLPDPHLAARVANRTVQLLNAFNIERRKTRAGERRFFAEQRLAETSEELKASELVLTNFLERNRSYEASAVLRFQNDRLQRQVSLQQELQATLARELETARLEEVNETPVLTIVDEATAPASRDSPRRARIAVTSSMLALTLVMFVLLLRRYTEMAKSLQASGQ